MALTEVTEGVYVTTSSVDTMATTIVVAGAECLVVDPGVTAAELASISADIRTLGARPVVGWSTHAHWDHLLWTKALGMPPRYATAKAASIAGSTRGKLAVQANKEQSGLELNLLGAVKPLTGSTLPWSGPETTVIEHNGHAPGHGALFIAERGVLIAGDTCSDIEIPTLDLDAASALADYRSFLVKLMELDGVKYVIPGHGTPTDTGGLLNRIMRDRVYLDYIEASYTVVDRRLKGAPDWLAEHHKQQVWKLHPLPTKVG